MDLSAAITQVQRYLYWQFAVIYRVPKASQNDIMEQFGRTFKDQLPHPPAKSRDIFH